MSGDVLGLLPVPFVSSRERETAVEWCKSSCDHPLGADKEKIVSYLRSGHCVAAVPGIERDCMANNAVIADPPHVRTDGRWLWVQTLAYWVEQYDVELPSEFVVHICQNKFLPPSTSGIKITEANAPWRADKQFFWPRSFRGAGKPKVSGTD